MNTKDSVAAILAAVVLGVTGVGMVLFGVFLPSVSLATEGLSGAARVAVLFVGAVSVATGFVAGFAAWAVATRRPMGAVIGLGIGAVLELTVAVAALSGGWHPALWAAVAIGAITLALTATLLTRSRLASSSM